MANSTIQKENDHGFQSKYASFDDASSMSSGREDFLLALVSSTSGSTIQDRNQKRSLTIIEACGVHPEVLDAADPANTLVRDELCEMSGIHGVFPQFFLVQGDRTSYFADFSELEHMNEEGTLAEWLSMELPVAKSLSENSLVSGRVVSASRPPNVDCHGSQSHSIQGNGDVRNGAESDHGCDLSSATEDLLNAASISKILKSMDTKCDNVPIEPLRHHEQCIAENKGIDIGIQDLFLSELSVPTTSTVQDEWSDPLLLERYEDEIRALEDYLQESDDDGGDQNQEQHKRLNGSELQSKEKHPEKIQQIVEPGFGMRASPKSHISSKNKNTKEYDMKGCQHQQNYKSVSSLSSMDTTVTITPTSSSSRSQSPDRKCSQENSSPNQHPSTLSTPLPLLYKESKNNDKEISCNISMETVSTRSDTEQLLRAEVKELRKKCEKLTAERYIIEGQLKEARQKNINDEQQTLNQHSLGTTHKSQLQQAIRCAFCTSVFNSNPSSLNAPIASQACGHSICRNCCYKRLIHSRKAARRQRDENTMNSSERLRSTISSDLFMCGMGDMSQVYSPSFEKHQRQLQEYESCPVCCAPRAFRQGKLYVNESLCTVLKLVEN